MSAKRRQARSPQPVGKIAWHGLILSVQPRIRLLRSFDQRSHSYLGYVLRLQGDIGAETREFLVALGEGAHSKHQFQAGDEVNGESVLVADSRMETAELYKVSKLQVRKRSPRLDQPPESPPWLGIPPKLTVYRERGHQRLDARVYKTKYSTCIWGCKMPVEMIIDHWNPSQKRYREETFCYGPLSCSHHKAGPTRKVPGRKGMTWEEADWIDEDAVSHRSPDD